ncbi:unnamed protein product [Cuscuta campestris]|uniref:Uncharacterized protein n=1 Tax=Cuscuta campestris TaxID=132261 RepID=A0A484NA18_9ASTE|nr:unnamed protein product [Cuscuta campestris]
MQPPSPHSHFFSSLKRLEKRLKLETPQNQREIVSGTSSESLSSPLYLNSLTQPTTTSNIQESEVPQEFLSSPDFVPTRVEEDPPKETAVKAEGNVIDDIDLLMQLLGFSGPEEGGSHQRAVQKLGCDDGFYGNVVGVKGVKSRKEFERLDGWIKHFLNGEGERREPLRLAHLLLGKAAFLNSMNNEESDGIEFPSTIDEFLQNDPPHE